MSWADGRTWRLLQTLLNRSPFAEVDANLVALADLLVVNQHGFASMIGTPAAGLDDADWSRATDALTARGLGHVIVTIGAARAGRSRHDLVRDDRTQAQRASQRYAQWQWMLQT